uniref:N-acetyltransferase domain-containing protein n=2 Tax=Clastoptera arizonana TaxID=38151 RepID=A0A1B6DVR1_9HEMI
MELLPEGKNFRLAQEDELPEILEFLSNYLPDSLKFHQTLKTFLNDRVWDFFFYISKSWPDDPVILHFPGMTSTPNGRLYESFSVFCPKEKLESLHLLEAEDILIDWTQPLFLNFTRVDIMKRLENFYSSIGTMEKVCGDVYICSELPLDITLDELPAEEVKMQELQTENAEAIHELYPANDMESIEVFKRLIVALPAYGIFSSGDLAAWMVQSYYGAMFSMQTRPEYRRKGYGIHLAHILTNTVRSRGYIPFVVIRPENDASQSLYLKLGFKKHYQTVRAILRPYEESSTHD